MTERRRAWSPRGGVFGALLVWAVLLVSLIAFAPVAAGDIVFGDTQGSGAGETDNPVAIAVDHSAGLLFVADRGNNRVSVFSVDGSFVRAFGWGVADGTTPALQTCTVTCAKGLAGGGAGQFSELTSIAVDNEDSVPGEVGDVYVTDGTRVQRLSTDDNGTPADPSDDFAVFERAWGGGVVTGGAEGSGDLLTGSPVVTNVKTIKKRFALGQQLSGAGIPAGTRIIGLGNGTITLSQAATSSGAAATLSVAEGVGNVPIDEVQKFEFTDSGFAPTFRLRFVAPSPNPDSLTNLQVQTTPPIPSNASAEAVQEALEKLLSIGVGNVTVTSPNPGGVPGVLGGPYTITFSGARYADTDVAQLGSPSPNRRITTIQNGGGSAELCTQVNAVDCASGVFGYQAGQFLPNQRIAVGPGGEVDVAGDANPEAIGIEPVNERKNRIQSFDSDGAFISQVALPESSSPIVGFAVDSGGSFYVATDDDVVRKYDPSGACLSCLDPLVPTGGEALGLDTTDNLFVANAVLGQTAVAQFDPSGAPQRVLYGNGTLKSAPVALAPYSSATGDLFVIEGSSPRRLAHIAFEPPGPVVLPLASDTKANPVGNIRATLNARVNPEGKSTTVEFQYVDDASYDANGEGFASPNTVTSSEVGPIGSDFTPHEASFAIPCAAPGNPGCLAADTEYHFRAIAFNADAEGGRIGPESTFKTLPPITLNESWATEVSSDSATLHASLNPNGIAATAFFEYVDDATFQATGFDEATATPPIDFGSGSNDVTKSATLFPLEPGTTYHYRYVASDFFGEFIGPAHTLTTYSLPSGVAACPSNEAFRVGASAGLPDCRAYEMVSPVDKNNGDIETLLYSSFDSFGQNRKARFEQAEPVGSGLTYSSATSFGSTAESAPWSSQYVARRDPAFGWTTENISAPRKSISYFPPTSPSASVLYQGFSKDLCNAWFVQDTNLQLTADAPSGVPGLYRQQLEGPGCPAAGYQALTTVEPPTHKANPIDYATDVEGFSVDGNRTIFKANDKLTEEASSEVKPPPSNEPVTQLYFAEGGHPNPDHVVSMLPPKGKSASAADADSEGHAVSEDARRVVWSTEGELYLRLNADQPQSVVSGGACTDSEKGCTTPVSGTVSATESSLFQAADPQVDQVLFTIETGGLAGNLYSFDVGTKTSTLLLDDMDLMLGVSRDLSRMYFVADEILAPGAIAGRRNIYFHEAGSVTLVASLPVPVTEDIPSASLRATARIDVDGLRLAFMSRSQLTGYDNTVGEKASGERAEEVFLFDAAAEGGAGRLLCVSCNPTAARPQGARNFDGEGGVGQAKPRFIAALMPDPQSSLHSSSALSADGSRVFFESFEALIPLDTNGRADVYQWEAPGSGDCSSTDSNFFFRNGGCLSLISSGTSAEDSRFVDASVDGADVFFATESSLLPQDPGLIDIYNARVGGGFPPPDPPELECEGDACQPPASSPEDSTPASSAFRGPGDSKPTRPRKPRCPKGKHRVRKAGKFRCVRKKSKQGHKKRRHRAAGRVGGQAR